MELLKKYISEEVVLIDESIRKELLAIPERLDQLLEEVLDYCLFNGGKRVRPLLVILASRLCGKDDENLYSLAAAFEYLHVATLLHDDVIDRADTRRGKPSVNKAYDMVAAILAGDFLLAHSMKLVGKLSGQAGLDSFCKATYAMVDGEFVQLRNSFCYDLKEEHYFDAVQGKTGALITSACETGVIYGGGSSEQREGMKQYGIHLGAAFQIIDDILDYSGDASKTGKAVGNDLIEGKVTLPLILCLKDASSEDRKMLLALLEDDEKRKTGFEQVVELLNKYSSLEKSREQAHLLVEKAVAGLNAFEGKDSRSLEILHGLAQYVLSRNK